MKRAPAVLYAFDVLGIAGKDTREKTLVERRLALSHLVPAGEAVHCSELCDDGRGLFAAVTARSLEGVDAKPEDNVLDFNPAHHAEEWIVMAIRDYYAPSKQPKFIRP